MPFEIIVGAVIGAVAVSKPVRRTVRKAVNSVVAGCKYMFDDAEEIARPKETKEVNNEGNRPDTEQPS